MLILKNYTLKKDGFSVKSKILFSFALSMIAVSALSNASNFEHHWRIVPEGSKAIYSGDLDDSSAGNTGDEGLPLDTGDGGMPLEGALDDRLTGEVVSASQKAQVLLDQSILIANAAWNKGYDRALSEGLITGDAWDDWWPVKDRLEVSSVNEYVPQYMGSLLEVIPGKTWQPGDDAYAFESMFTFFMDLGIENNDVCIEFNNEISTKPSEVFEWNRELIRFSEFMVQGYCSPDMNMLFIFSVQPS